MKAPNQQLGVLRGIRKKLRRGLRALSHGYWQSRGAWWLRRNPPEVQIALWARFEEQLELCRQLGVVSDFGYQHLRNRMNVVREFWGCTPPKGQKERRYVGRRSR